jgi:hypothetical protein
MKADMVPAVLTSKIVSVGAIAFGAAAFQGAGDTQVKPGAASAVFVGVAIQDPVNSTTTAPATADAYQVNDVALIMQRGTVHVTTGAAVVAGDPAYVERATGAYVKVVGTDNILIGKWRTSAASGALAVLELT